MAKMLTRIRKIFSSFHDTTMFLTLMLWLCLAPFVLIFTVPFMGWQAGLAAVLITFSIVLALCWGVCLLPKISEETKTNAH